MKKVILLLALLAMLAVAAVPAIAASKDNNDAPLFNQQSMQDVQSGDSTQTFNVSGGGDNSNTCQGIQGVSNTGNLVNNTAVLQYASSGDVSLADSGNFTISPSNDVSCSQSVSQVAVAY